MYIHKQHIDDAIRCHHSFALGVLKDTPDKPRKLSSVFEKLNKSRSTSNSTPVNTEAKKLIADVRTHLAEIASHELKNDEKLSLAEYRVRYTNKYCSKVSDVFGASEMISKLNTIFQIFAENNFMAYNVPVDIPIAGTNLIYRDIVDFVLSDDEGNVIAVEFDDLSDFEGYKRKLVEWAHYISPYAYLSNAFGKPVRIVIIDPNDFSKIETHVGEKYFESTNSDELNSLVRPIQKLSLTKNFYACATCDYRDICEGK